MELYNFYNLSFMILRLFSKDAVFCINLGAILGVVLWVAMFILQGVGLCVMAKRCGQKKRWLAFVPFANIYYMGKLAGECGFFGHKMKNAGLYAMIAQIVATLLTIGYVFCEVYLYHYHGVPDYVDETNTLLSTPIWSGLTGFSLGVSKAYAVGGSILSIFTLIAEMLFIVLLMGLYRDYAPRNFRVLALLSFFVPVSRFIVVFVLRNRERIDYGEYVRRQREAYARRQQQYYNYGNPYGGPYGNPYGQNGYGNYQPPQPPPPKPEEPFEEFSSKGGDEPKDGEETPSTGDGFFD